MEHPLPQSFFARDTLTVTRELIGTVLHRTWRGQHFKAVITEAESYIGEKDQACHARFGPTPRTQIMWGPPGRTYVYLIYGIHHMLNIVTEEKGSPAAILIRAALLRTHPPNTTNGPGKFTKVLRINGRHNNIDVTTDKRLSITKRLTPLTTADIETTPRIGIDYAGKDALLPWRFVLTRQGYSKCANKFFDSAFRRSKG